MESEFKHDPVSRSGNGGKASGSAAGGNYETTEWVPKIENSNAFLGSSTGMENYDPNSGRSLQRTVETTALAPPPLSSHENEEHLAMTELRQELLKINDAPKLESNVEDYTTTESSAATPKPGSKKDSSVASESSSVKIPPPSKFQIEIRRRRVSFHMNEGESFLRNKQWESAEKSFKLAINDLRDIDSHDDDGALEKWDCYLGWVEAMIHLQRCPERRILVKGLLEDIPKSEGSTARDIRKKLHWIFIVHKVIAANITKLGETTREDLVDLDVLAEKAMEAMEQASTNVEQSGGDPECSLLSSEAALLLSKIRETRGDSSNARFYQSLVMDGFVSSIDRRRSRSEPRIKSPTQPSKTNPGPLKKSPGTNIGCRQCLDAEVESCLPLNRTWVTNDPFDVNNARCDRCVKFGLPCSPQQRETRIPPAIAEQGEGTLVVLDKIKDLDLRYYYKLMNRQTGEFLGAYAAPGDIKEFRLSKHGDTTALTGNQLVYFQAKAASSASEAFLECVISTRIFPSNCLHKIESALGTKPRTRLLVPRPISQRQKYWTLHLIPQPFGGSVIRITSGGQGSQASSSTLYFGYDTKARELNLDCIPENPVGDPSSWSKAYVETLRAREWYLMKMEMRD